MTQEELKQKVINAENKVEKRNSVLEKHKNQLKRLIEKNADQSSIHIKQMDIESAEKKLREAKEIFLNWKKKLDDRISEDERLEANTPKVIKDFLENWEEHAIAYYKDRRVRFLAFKEDLRKQEREARLEALRTLPELEQQRKIFKNRDLTDYDLANLWPRKVVDKFLKERGLDYSQIREKIRDAGDYITIELAGIKNEQDRDVWLKKKMDEEKRAKMLDLMYRINRIVGTITDAENLQIGANGEINGIIEGTEGRARIETIGAGGYNIQCFHFRTIIHEI